MKKKKKEKMSLKILALLLLEKYKEAQTAVIYEYCTNIAEAEENLKRICEKYRKEIEGADE